MTQVVLVKGKTYFYKNFQFTVNKPKFVDDELAQALLSIKNDLGISVFKVFDAKTRDEIQAVERGLDLMERGDITSEELLGKTAVAAPKKEKEVREVVAPTEPTDQVEVKKSIDYSIPKAVKNMKEINDVQSLVDFTNGDERKGILSVRDAMMDKMGPSGAGMADEEAVIV